MWGSGIIAARPAANLDWDLWDVNGMFGIWVQGCFSQFVGHSIIQYPMNLNNPINHGSDDEEALDAARRELNGEVPVGGPRPFVYACELSEIPADGMRGKSVAFEGGEVALFRLKGQVFAISNICPHEMSPLLAAGLVDREACTVACPLHGWTYEIETGRQVAGSGGVPLPEPCAGVATYQVKLIGEEVWVEDPNTNRDLWD